MKKNENHMFFLIDCEVYNRVDKLVINEGIVSCTLLAGADPLFVVVFGGGGGIGLLENVLLTIYGIFGALY